MRKQQQSSSLVVVFDIASSFGYFRKNFTTTNALTHAVIPRSAVEGLVGAIVGLSINDYPEKLQSSSIAIELKSPVRKMHMKYMHTNPDWWQNISLYLQKNTNSKNIQFAVPSSVEFLVDPKYRIYIDAQAINHELSKMLKNKQTYYTPFLGSSSMICSTKYVGEFNYTVTSSAKDYLPVSSMVHFSEKIPQMHLQKESRFAIEEGLPMHIDNHRISHGTYKVLYTPEPQDMQIKDKDIVEVYTGKERTKKYVKFLPSKISS